MPEIFSQPSQPKFTYPATIRNDVGSTNPLSPFLIKPKHVKTNVLEEDEHVIVVLREHPIMMLRRLFTIVAIIGLGIFFNGLIKIDYLPQSYLAGFGILWYLFLFGLAFEKVVSWYFNTIIITDERIIDIDFVHLIYKNITVAKLDNIEDVTYSVTGVFPSLLNYGNVLIQTAGAVTEMSPQQTQASIEIWNVPDPTKITKVLNDLMLQEEQEKLEGRAK